MKKILGIVILSFFLSFNAYSDHTHVFYKDANKIHILVPKHGSTYNGKIEAQKAQPVAIKHCESHNKYTFEVAKKTFGWDKIDKHYKQKVKQMGVVGVTWEYVCSKEYISKAPSFAIGAGRKIALNNYPTNTSNQTVSSSTNSAQTSNTTSTNDKIAQSKQICKDLGFKVNSEKFADCALKMMSIQFEATNKVASGSGTKQEIIVKHKQDYDIWDAMLDMSNALSGSSSNNNSSSSGSSGTRCVIQKTHAWGHTVMNCN